MDLQGALGRGHLKLGVGGKKEPAGEPAFCPGSSRCRARIEELRAASDAGLGGSRRVGRETWTGRDPRAGSHRSSLGLSVGAAVRVGSFKQERVLTQQAPQLLAGWG